MLLIALLAFLSAMMSVGSIRKGEGVKDEVVGSIEQGWLLVGLISLMWGERVKM
jgi:hypothetical protein